MFSREITADLGRPLRLPNLLRNERQKASAVRLLSSIEDGEAALVFLDPQYRAVLDKMKYGNEGARQKRRHGLRAMTDDDIAFLVEESCRALRPSGHLMLWVDKFMIGEAHHHRYFMRTPDLRRVELFHWNTIGFGMGARGRGVSQYLVIAQKLPLRSKGVWTDKAIRDSWAEASDRTGHPHAKPAALTERLIRAVTKRGDLVVDPCAGSWTVLDACRRAGREFVGADLEG